MSYDSVGVRERRATEQRLDKGIAFKKRCFTPPQTPTRPYRGLLYIGESVHLVQTNNLRLRGAEHFVGVEQRARVVFRVLRMEKHGELRVRHIAVVEPALDHQTKTRAHLRPVIVDVVARADPPAADSDRRARFGAARVRGELKHKKTRSAA